MPGTVGRVPTPTSAVADARPPRAPVAPPIPSGRWADTVLGPPDDWDPAIRTVVDLVLTTPVAMVLAYGDDLALIYNHGFAELLGQQHPEAFGRPAAEVFGDVWRLPGVGDVIERVYRTGEPCQENEGEPFQEREKEIVRSGRQADPARWDKASDWDDARGWDDAAGPEPAPLPRGCSAVRDATGRIVGVLAVVAETSQVTQRLQSLSELAAALAGTLTLDDVARVTLRSALAAFGADQVEFGVDDGGGWRVVRRVRGEVLDEADERLPPLWRRLDADSTAPLVRVAEGGTPRFTRDGQPLSGAAVDRHDEKIRALAVLPLRMPTLRGGLAAGYRRPHHWPAAERALLAACAELVAQAAERARRFETQHGTAQLLQRSMLPEHLPDLPALRIAARYEAGVDGNAAGGDFYDAFALPDGQLAVVLGDVAGHDVRAAALMGQVRAALRALALSDPDPVPVLAGLDRLVASLGAEAHSDELFVTVLYGVINPERGQVTLASAGHPTPLIRRAAPGQPATTRYVEVPPGVPLGLSGSRTAVPVGFRPGDTLLLFSDGVVERRGRSLTDGFAALAATIAGSATGDPRTLCALATSAVAGNSDDDVAVLAVEHASAPSQSVSMEVPPEPTGPGRVRRWMSRQLTTWGVPESVISAAVLCTSELTTNALLHAGTAARVEIDLNPERLLVSVADRGTRGAVTRTHTEKLSTRGRGLGLIEQLSDAWGTDPTVRGSTVWFELLLPGDGGSN